MAQPGQPLLSNPAPEHQFDLFTLGAAALVRPDGKLVLSAGKPLALLAFLHAAPRRTASREHLCSLLWGDSSPDRAHAALRTSLNRLRNAVGSLAVESDTDEVSLTAEIASDRDQFLAALDTGCLEQAIELYQGPFFRDYSDAGTALFEEWADLERARLQEFFVRASETLVRRLLAAGHARSALHLARRCRALVPESESLWRLVLESFLAARDHLGARAEAEAFEVWLAAGEKKPEAATLRLLQLARQEAPASAGEGSNPALYSELVGREREFSAIVHAWEHAAQGSPRHLHLQAAPGFGKSRLLHEARTRLAALGATVVSLRATPGERDIGYAFAAELARGLGLAPGAAGVMPSAAPVLIDLQPSLGLHLSNSEGSSSGGDLTLRRAQALGELISAVADEKPLALLIDDVHWMDRESWTILVSLSERLGHRRVLLVTASRRMERPAGEAATIISLPALSRADTEALISSTGTPPSSQWAERLATALHQATRGSPLLILESLRLAQDRGELSLENGAWHADDLDLVMARFAAAGTLEARIALLGPEDRRLLLLIATLGMPIADQDLRSLQEGTGPVCRERLEELERTGYLMRREAGWDLIHDEIAASVIGLASLDEQRAIHQAAGEWLAGTAGHELATVTRAARHLAQAEAASSLQRLFIQHLRRMRKEGDRSTSTHLARQLLGEQATPSWLDRLHRGLPLRLKHPALRRVVVTAAAAGAVVAATMALIPLRDSSPPEAEFLLYRANGAGDSLEAYRFPVRRDRWRAGDSIRLAEGERIPGLSLEVTDYSFAPRPGELSVAYVQVMPDSGVTDIFLKRADGSSLRLTETAGDDVNPSWSPDGAFLAFATARWTPRGDEDSDIAILELATGKVRQVTGGPEYDDSPFWSPDGTRIAFHRSRMKDGGSQVCWSTVDGMIATCLDGLFQSHGLIAGWRDPRGLILGIPDSPTQLALSVLHLDTRRIEPLGVANLRWAAASPAGDWILATRQPDDEKRTVTEAFPLGEPGRRRPFASEITARDRHAEWLAERVPLDRHWSLRIVSRGEAVVGVSHRLEVSGVTSDGADAPFARETVHWRTADSSIASIHPRTGLVRPKRAGTAWVMASAGGWRTDSILLLVRAPSHEVVFEEAWTDSTLSGWESFGTPRPIVVSESRFGPAFLNNGDNAFESGALTRTAFRADQGLGFEGWISVPVRRPKWQTMRIRLAQVNRVMRNGVDASGCGFTFPRDEGEQQMNLITVSTNTDAALLKAPPTLSDGRRHTLRIQIFPDMTCGVAIDGTPIWRSRVPLSADSPFRVLLFGRTVGAKLLVGPFQVWQGVRIDVDWERVDKIRK